MNNQIKNIVETHKVGVVVENYEPKSIAKEIQNLLENKELYQQIKLNQQKAKNEFCWEKEQQILDNYFN